MSSAGGGVQPPPILPHVDVDAFKRLISSYGKKLVPGPLPKFVKKLANVPIIALPPDQPMHIAASLVDQALVGQFTSLPLREQRITRSEKIGAL